jgi:tetratricopeptide (TPR) repeat protein
LLRQLGRHDEAAALVKGAPPTAHSVRILEDAGRIEDAIQAYLRVGDHANALALLPKAKLDPIGRAKILLECQRPLEAATAFVQAGDLPNAARAAQAGGETVRAARLWEQAQLHAEAAASYRQARQWEDAARCATMAGDTLGAAEAFRAAGDHQRAGYAFLQAKRPLEAATCFLTHGDKQAATQSLRQVAGGTPDAVKATILLAPLLFEQEQYSDGLLRLEMLPSLSGTEPKLEAERLLWQGQFLERLGRVEEALLAYRKVLILRPDDPLALARHETLKAAGFRAASTTAMRSALAAPAAPVPPAAPPMASLWEWPPGTVVAGRYEIVRELGRGGMGRVYRARDREMGEEIAIKVVLGRAETSEEDRLRREVQITRRLTHPNIVRVFDLGRHDGVLYVTMEVVDGQRLDHLIAGAAGTPLDRIRDITSQIASGLAVAHAVGVVHRDLKPGNVILTAQGVKILDFGIARPLDATTQLTQTGYALGTPAYMSPEQVRGEPLDGRSDLYALGVVVFTLLCGREPFLAENPTAVALMHLQNQPPDVRQYRADAPAEWALFVDRLLEKDPAARYAMAADVERAVAALPA